MNFELLVALILSFVAGLLTRRLIRLFLKRRSRYREDNSEFAEGIAGPCDCPYCESLIAEGLAPIHPSNGDAAQ